MAVAIPSKQAIELTDNRIVGNGEVVGIRTENGIKYALPGNRYIKSKRLADHYAAKLDRMITANMKKFNRHKFL